MIWIRERLEHDWFIPQELRRIFYSKSFGGFLPPITTDFLSYWRYSKTLQHINWVYTWTTSPHKLLLFYQDKHFCTKPCWHWKCNIFVLNLFQAGERNSSARQTATANQTPNLRLYHPQTCKLRPMMTSLTAVTLPQSSQICLWRIKIPRGASMILLLVYHVQLIVHGRL
jgi:hypothetical protein